MRAFSGLILAGGRGARFGGPKAFARLPDGRTFLESCAGSLQEAGADPVLATLPLGVQGPEPKGIISHAVDPSLDMFSSLRQGLYKLVESRLWQHVIILPVDHPLVEPETFQHLASSPHPAAIATFRGHHGHPVLLHRSIVLKILDDSLSGPTLREILKRTEAVDVEVDDPQTRSNCNTPGALEEAWRLKRKGRNPA